MKRYGTLLAIGLLAGFQAAAAPQPGVSTVFNTTAKKDISLLNPPPQTTEDKHKIERYGNMSSQPWTKTVGWHPGAAMSAFEDGEIHEPQLNLIWTGNEPQE
jgi:hypothetical protein